MIISSRTWWTFLVTVSWVTAALVSRSGEWLIMDQSVPGAVRSSTVVSTLFVWARRTTSAAVMLLSVLD